MTAVAQRGVLTAAQRLAGDDVESVCRTFAAWRERSQRELPWLAGPAFSALGRVVPPPAGASVRVLERFLVGAESDAEQVRSAIAACATQVADPPPQPPDARGALVDAVERFFDLLAQTYEQLHDPVRGGHRRYAEDAVAQAQPALDHAAGDIADRMLVLQGRGPVAPPPPRRAPERAGLALGFVVVSLVTALVVVWLVLQGWPVSPVAFDL